MLDNIEADLNQAIAVLPPNWSATNQAQNKGKATLGAARSLLAHVYMWRAGYEGRTEYYQRAVDLTAEILTGPYSLVPGAAYGTIFTAKNSAESIFELQFDAAGQETNEVGRLYLVTSTYGGSNAYQPSPKLVAAMDPADLRQAVSFVFVQGQYMVNKFFGSPGGGTIRLNDDNLILYRLADIILLRAEALNKTGRKPEAIEALNRIRQRAGLPATDVDDSSTEEAIETAILRERFVELCFEGHRWFDLVRTGRALQEIPSVKDRRNLLWPINISEIIRNPLLEQNEYYR